MSILFRLDPQSLAQHVPSATLARGLDVYRSQLVLECELQLASGNEWHIEGMVRGSQRETYAVSVLVESSDTGQITFFDGDCSCPVGSNCKHCVALTLKAAYRSAGARPAAPPPDPAEQAARLEAQQRAERARAHEQALQRVRQWLERVENATPTAPADTADHLVYMLIPVYEAGKAVLHLGRGLSRRLRNGNWAKVKQPRHLPDSGLSPQETEIARLIDSLEAHTYRYRDARHEGQLIGEAGLLALRMAADTGRLFSIQDERVLDRPLRCGPLRALAWAWSQTQPPQATEPLWTLAPQLAGAECFANDPPLYLDAAAGLFGRLESPGIAPAQLAHLLDAPPLPQSAFTEHETALLSRLPGLPLPPVLTPPAVLQGITPAAQVQIAPVPAADQARLGLLGATLRFDYDGLRHHAEGDASPVLVDLPAAAGGEGRPTRALLHRDLGTERARQASLQGWGLAGDAAGTYHLPPSASTQQAWLQWLDTDFAPWREAGFDVQVDAGLADWITRADALNVDLAPQESDDHRIDDDTASPWFDLSLGMQIDGQRHNILPLLPALLSRMDGARADGALQMPAHVYLPQADGRYLRLPTAPLRPWLQALLDLVGERGDPLQGDTLRLSRLEVLRLGTALQDGATWQGADRLQRMLQQLGGHQTLPDVAVPAGLQATLRPYQQHGLAWLQFLRSHHLGGILADDMGLGKTLQTLAHLLVEHEAGRLDRPALVIAPVSLLGNWRREAQRFAPALRVLVLHGQDRHEAAAEVAGHDLVIAPYSLLQRDRERWLRQPWHLVVLDEAQNIKNANTHAAQVVAELNTRHRLCLSGTPMENHLGELWSLFHFLMPGFLGSQARFKDLFRTPIEKLGDTGRLAQLRRRVTPFMLRRAKRDVATDLPDKQDSVCAVELGDRQADLYETIRLATEKAVRAALADKGLAKSQIQVLDALLKLRQVCCDPRLVPLAAARRVQQSAKLELLMELLPELLAEGRRVLLFSQFTSMLALIEEELARRALPWVKLTGQSQQRDQLIERFTSGQVPLFLISLKAGGVGLNLTQADTVIHYDPWWNPAVEEQATARAHRIGQTQNVMVYKLVAQGTIEERILALQERKAALAQSMYSDAAARKQPLFTESDLQELLKPLGA